MGAAIVGASFANFAFTARGIRPPADYKINGNTTCFHGNNIVFTNETDCTNFNTGPICTITIGGVNGTAYVPAENCINPWRQP